LTRYFWKDHDHGVADYEKIHNFVQQFAPIEKFPLEQDTIDEMLTQIFGKATEELRNIFNESIRLDSYLYENAETRFKDVEVNALLRNNPFSSLAEGILNLIPRHIHSAFLDATATDMKTLEELTKGWMQRFAGILLNFYDEPKNFTINYRMRESNEVEAVKLSPEYPKCNFENIFNFKS
jgi:hypothetical protein